MNSLTKNYSIEKPDTQLDLLVHINQNKLDNLNLSAINLRDKNSHLGDKDIDIIGMMWEPELDFVDDPESYNECTNKNGPMRYMCGICLGQFRSR